MKKFLYFALMLPLAWGCAAEEVAPKDDAELMRLTEQVRELREASADKDSTMNSLFLTFNEIEANLASIYEKEGNISSHQLDDIELQEDAKTRISQEVQAINELMVRNKEKIASLYAKLKTANADVTEFEKLVRRLEAQIVVKDKQIAELLKNLEELDIELDLLYDENAVLIGQVEDQIDELNRAYYCYGNSKELKEVGVVDKQGGFIGLGRIEKLREDFNKDYFTQIDITNKTEIVLNTKKAKLVTTHPAGSYELSELDGMINKLVIKDVQAFWSASKYLVIVVN
jgi:hypothetical protein